MLRRSAAALVATTILLAGGTGVNAALATTGPDPYVVVNVTLLDGRIMLSKLRVSHVTFVDFRVRNAGKLSHNFRIGGHTTPALKPGQTTHLLSSPPAPHSEQASSRPSCGSSGCSPTQCRARTSRRTSA